MGLSIDGTLVSASCKWGRIEEDLTAVLLTKLIAQRSRRKFEENM